MARVRSPREALPGAVPLDLESADGERLRALHVPFSSPTGGPARAGADVAVVLAHGFSGSLRAPAVAAIVAGLSAHAGVVAFDFRGHGDSSGQSTLGDHEVLDVDAAVRAARELGYRRVVTVGFSMGGATVLRHAGLHGLQSSQPVDAVVSVSAASRWFLRDTAAMRRLHWLVMRRSGRLVSRRLLNTRISAAGWEVIPAAPVEVVGRIAPTPLLLVHGDADHYFSVEHAHALRAAAGDGAELWIWPGFGHAEAAMTADRTDELGGHLGVLLARAAGVRGEG